MKHKYVISTVLWGEDFLYLFETITLPSLLARRNIPELAGSGSEYLIHVDIPGLERLKDSSVVQKLAQHITFCFKAINPELEKKYPNKYERMNHFHKEAIAYADSKDAPLIFVNPDQVFSDKAIERIVHIVSSGKRAIMVAGLRLSRESAVQALLEHSNGAGNLALTSRELVTLGAKHLHRWAMAMFWESDEFFCQNPTHLYFGDPERGMIARCWHLHPLVVYPQKKNCCFDGTIDADFVSKACPDVEAIHVITDSDELVLYDLTEQSRYEDLIARCTATPENATKVLINNIVSLHFHYFNQKIYFRIDDTNLNDIDIYSDTIAAQVAAVAKQRINGRSHGQY